MTPKVHTLTTPLSRSALQANYLEGTLQDTLAVMKEGGMEAVRRLDTVAALDLGGASTQITFIPTNNATLNASDEGRLYLYGDAIEVYTHSYLCYGQLQMTNRRLAFLLNKTAAADQIVDPCLPSGYTSAMLTEKELQDLAGNPCIAGLTTFDVEAHVNKSRLGGSDPANCNATVVDLFQGDAVQNADLPRANNGKFVDAQARQPPLPASAIYAFSAYWYAANFLYPTSCTETLPCNPPLSDFETKSVELCTKDLATIQSENPTTPAKYLVEYCQNTM
jgi:hypothetical protein